MYCWRFFSTVLVDDIVQVVDMALHAEWLALARALEWFDHAKCIAQFAGYRSHVAGGPGATVQHDDPGAGASVQAHVERRRAIHGFSAPAGWSDRREWPVSALWAGWRFDTNRRTSAALQPRVGTRR